MSYPFTRGDLRRAAVESPTAWAMYASGFGLQTDPVSGLALPGEWENAQHFDLLEDEVQRMRRLELQRLCVSLPPGHGKTEYLAIYVASWWLATRPHDRVVIASYGRDLARDPCVRARDLLAEHGLDVFGVQASQRDKAHWWRPRDLDLNPFPRGFCYAVGRGGSLTGKRSELLIIDDLFKDAEEAGSATVRAKVWEWLEKVALSRLLEWSCIIVIGTRWHRDDHIGRLESLQKLGRHVGGLPWKFVNLPCLAFDGDPLGRAKGEVLWPAQFSQQFMESWRDGYSPRAWACLYQGKPVAEGGELFREAWENLYTQRGDTLTCGDLVVPLSRLFVFSVCDFAGSKKNRADYTVITTFGLDHDTKTLWVLDVVRERLAAPEIVRAMEDVQFRWKVRVFYAEETGPQLNRVHGLALAAAAGKMIDPNEELQSNLLLLELADRGLPVRSLKPISDKVTRSAQAQTLMSAGKLYLPSYALWLPTWQDEVYSFPEAEHDDQVDCLSYGAIVFYQALQAQALYDARQRQQASDGVAGNLLD